MDAFGSLPIDMQLYLLKFLDGVDKFHLVISGILPGLNRHVSFNDEKYTKHNWFFNIYNFK